MIACVNGTLLYKGMFRPLSFSFWRTSLNVQVKHCRSFRGTIQPLSHDKQKYRLQHFNPHVKQTLPDPRDTVTEFSIIPIGVKDESSLGTFVATCARVIKNNNVQHEVHAMGAVIEGSLAECLDIIKQCSDACLKRTPRILISMKADIRPGNENRLYKKNAKINLILNSVEGGKEIPQSSEGF